MWSRGMSLIVIVLIFWGVTETRKSKNRSYSFEYLRYNRSQEKEFPLHRPVKFAKIRNSHIICFSYIWLQIRRKTLKKYQNNPVFDGLQFTLDTTFLWKYLLPIKQGFFWEILRPNCSFYEPHMVLKDLIKFDMASILLQKR